MLNCKNSTIEKLLNRKKEIYTGKFNKKVVYKCLDEIKLSSLASSIKLNIGLENKDGYIEIINAGSRIYYDNKNSDFWKNNNSIILEIDNTSEVVIKAQFISNFNCNNNKITKLDISKSKHLSWLECHGNLLVDLDLSNNNNIDTIDCSNNKQLTNINFNKIMKSTTYLNYSNTGIASLDLNKLPRLECLNCAFCVNISNIDISKNKKLKNISCNNCSLSNLNTSNNPQLFYINCDNNNITILDTSKNSFLIVLKCNKNYLSSLNIKNNNSLLVLECDSNKLKNLDVSSNSNIESLRCSNNLLDTDAIISLFNQLLNINNNKQKFLTIAYNSIYLSNQKELVDAINKLKEKGWEVYMN